MLVDPQIHDLYNKGERHRKIDIAFVDMLLKTFAHQTHAYQDQEREGQYLDAGIAVHKIGDGG